MTPRVELPIATADLATLRSDFEAGLLTKLAYNGEMWNNHQRLFDYARFLPGTNVEAIEITEDAVVFRLRDPKILLRCTPSDQRHVAITSFNFGQYELHDFRVVMRLAKACSVIVDIGANTGFYSIALGQRYPYAQIVAFEPIPATYGELVRNLTLNGITNVSTYNVGLSDRTSDEPFYFDVTVPGATSGAPLGPEFGPTQTLICPVQSLDAFVERTGTAPDFIKCDVEGGELRVFRGAADTLARFKPIVFTEMLRKWSARFGYHPNEMMDFFRSYGYDCFVVNGAVLAPFAQMTEETIETNFFFLHRQRHLEMVRFFGLLP